MLRPLNELWRPRVSMKSIQRAIPFVLFLALAASAFSQGVGQWPMERQDRWGDGRARSGPASSEWVQPWVYKVMGPGLISHGPALAPNGYGYFGGWIENKAYRFLTHLSQVLPAKFQGTAFIQSTPALGSNGNVYINQLDKLFAIDPSTMDYKWFFTT